MILLLDTYRGRNFRYCPALYGQGQRSDHGSGSGKWENPEILPVGIYVVYGTKGRDGQIYRNYRDLSATVGDTDFVSYWRFSLFVSHR